MTMDLIKVPKGITITPTGFEAETAIDERLAAKLSQGLLEITSGIQWVWGGFLNKLEEQMGEQFSQFIPEFPDVQRNGAKWMWVDKKIPMQIRFDPRELSWSHHENVAGMEDVDEMKRWLQLAVDNAWTARQMRSEIKAAQKPPDPEPGASSGEGEGESKPKTIAVTCPECKHAFRIKRPGQGTTEAVIAEEE